MSGRAQPIAGADSDYTLYPFFVLLESDDGDRVSVTVNAMGSHDARNQARDLHEGYNPIHTVRQVAA